MSKEMSMTKLLVSAALLSALTSPALAQILEAPPRATVAVPPGGPGVVTPGTNATGRQGVITYSPTGQAADAISNDSAAAGNAGQPSLVAPQGSGGGE